MMLGREVIQPADVILGVTPNLLAAKTPEDYVENLEQIIFQTHEAARSKLQSTIQKTKKDYDMKAKLNIMSNC